MKQPQFVAEEVWRCARSVVEDAVSEEAHGRGSYQTCKHCDERVWWQQSPNDIKHSPDCLFLIARDLLTGAPPE